MKLISTPTTAVLWGPAPIDWCEDNHPSTNPFSIAEFHNTWTNIFYVISSLILLKSHLKLPSTQRDILFTTFIINIILTGLTSGWFHATLLFIAQKSDEFFENAAIVSLLYYHVFPLDSNNNTRRIIYYIIHTILLGLGVLYIPEIFCEIHLIICVLITFSTSYDRAMLLPLENITRAIYNFKKSFMSVAVAFGCWLLDFLLCSYVKQFYLHAYAWHLGTAVALYYGGIASLVINEKPKVLQEKSY
ncbi:hypothetical protein TrLO_g459 [Triparma laevis f. longispina]|uniref:Alkaline phytoceramidase n=1 Tax=Triparma laevis f. longispina TaxID=1714387 RepID=A0A9W7FL87_9STRA|nr:hypothetical protein TrLO_g459 [Triparma laevis f. longispina]